MTFAPPCFEIEHCAVAHREQFFPAGLAQHTVTVHQTGEMAQLRIIFDSSKQRHHKRQLGRGFAATHRYPFNKQHRFADMAKHLIHAHGLRHWRGMLRTPLQAGITLLANHSVPHHFAVNNLQRLMRTLWHALPTVIATSHRPRIVTVFAAQIAALQKQSQTTAWPVNAGEGDNLTD